MADIERNLNPDFRPREAINWQKSAATESSYVDREIEYMLNQSFSPPREKLEPEPFRNNYQYDSLMKVHDDDNDSMVAVANEADHYDRNQDRRHPDNDRATLMHDMSLNGDGQGGHGRGTSPGDRITPNRDESVKQDINKSDLDSRDTDRIIQDQKQRMMSEDKNDRDPVNADEKIDRLVLDFVKHYLFARSTPVSRRQTASVPVDSIAMWQRYIPVEPKSRTDRRLDRLVQTSPREDYQRIDTRCDTTVQDQSQHH